MNKKRIRIFLSGITICFLLFACNTKEAVMLETEVEVINPDEMRESDGQNTCVFVYICGEVQNPGVYTVKDTTRLYEVLNEAGGYTIKADKEAINLAEIVSDGLRICIPKKTESFDVSLEKKDGLVNINTASESELIEIPGVGVVKAKAIIAYRTEHGGFTKEEEITMVDGIKTGTYEKIKEYISVN